VEERLVSERYAKDNRFKTCKGTGKKGAWIMWRRQREKNGGRGRRESAKRQRVKVHNEILFYSYSK